jgi:hypothetical protein
MKRLAWALLLFMAGATAEAAETSSGSGVVINSKGEILTNSHVVEACAQITARLPFDGNIEAPAILVARDERNDLAVIRVTRPNIPAPPVAAFRGGDAVRAGDAVVVLGYPLSGLLASTASVSVGNVSALAGLHDDSRYLQISAPVQPGNSGGPLLDASGHVIGIVTAKLNPIWAARVTGDIPQNVNFALKAEVARTFLDSKGITYRFERSELQLAPADVGDNASPFTVYIECRQTVARSAAVTTMSGPSPDAKREEFNRQFRLCVIDRRIAVCNALIQSRHTIADKTLVMIFTSRGTAYVFKRDFSGAISDFTEAIRLNPRFSFAFYGRGMAYSFIKEYGLSIADFDEAVRLNPRDAMAFSERGGTYRAMGITVVLSLIITRRSYSIRNTLGLSLVVASRTTSGRSTISRLPI